uniref:Helicase C-terminal domain-containing protein n=1 Tax=Ditylenchus dipsaci TaxID=166011 RepID=A0A915DIU6_9BILA
MNCTCCSTLTVVEWSRTSSASCCMLSNRKNSNPDNRNECHARRIRADLREHVFMDSGVYEYPKMQKLRDLQQDYVIKSDTKGVIGMTMEAVMEDKAVLIFCSTKAECERNAALVGKYVSYCLSKGANNRFDRLNSILAPPHQKEIVDYFAKKTMCQDKDLLSCIGYGVSFHHAGLTVEEREEIEFLFRKGSVKILVNLPAHRVLILPASNTYISLTSTTYKQMVGRAGRQGQDVVAGN